MDLDKKLQKKLAQCPDSPDLEIALESHHWEEKRGKLCPLRARASTTVLPSL